MVPALGTLGSLLLSTVNHRCMVMVVVVGGGGEGRGKSTVAHHRDASTGRRVELRVGGVLK